MKIPPMLACLILLFLAGPALAKPQLVPTDPALHFGTIAEGDTIDHVFTFTNQGDETLVIDRVRTSCGCTGTLLSQRKIAPGTSGEVKIHFNSNGMQGPVVKWIYLFSNDPDTPKTRLQLSGVIQPEIEVQPRRLRLTGIKPGEKRQVRIALTNHGQKTLFLSGLMAAPAELSATLPESRLEPGDTVSIEGTLEIPPGKQHQNGYITISTSSPRTPKIRIPVFGVGTAAAP